MPYNLQVYNGSDKSLHNIHNFQSIPDERIALSTIYSLSMLYPDTLLAISKVSDYGIPTVSKSFNKYYMNGLELVSVEESPLKLFEYAVDRYEFNTINNNFVFKVCEVEAKDSQVTYKFSGNKIEYHTPQFDNLYSALNYMNSLKAKDKFYCLHKIIGIDSYDIISYYYNQREVDYEFINNFALVNLTDDTNRPTLGIGGKVVIQNGTQIKLLSEISLYASKSVGLEGYVELFKKELKDLPFVIESQSLTDDEKARLSVSLLVLTHLTEYMKSGNIGLLRNIIW